MILVIIVENLKKFDYPWMFTVHKFYCLIYVLYLMRLFVQFKGFKEKRKKLDYSQFD